jgi:eukaryotic-like serine/threonine-protein kinase
MIKFPHSEVAALGIGQSEGIVCFEGFELDVRSAELRNPDGKTLRLSEQPLRILIALLERPGELILREDLRNRLWPNDTVVEFEHSINAAVNRLRQALGDSADTPKFIETLARRGYRWKTSIQWEQPQANPAPPKPADGHLIGKRVSHYRVLEILGGGGMGVVYKAEDIKLGRRVALKFLPGEFAGDAAALKRFEREARAASALNHHNICTIYAVEEHEGQPFLVMELLEGHTLRDELSQETDSKGDSLFRLEPLLDTAIQVANGLEAAHQKGIIHRDIKPANIFITNRGQVKILDFGLAKLHESESVDPPPQSSAEPGPKQESNPLLTLTRTGVTVGTAAYMSPEQVRGERLDPRTDLFSFGLVLYEMATRQRAFPGDSAPVLHHAILNQAPVPVRELNGQVPVKLENIVNRALEKDRNVRYQTAAEIRADLESLKVDAKPRRSGWWAAAAGVTALCVVILALWSARRRPQLQPIAPEVKVRQLTVNSSDNRVINGVISPDGKYLAYVDLKGMHLQIVDSGETRAIPLPDELSNQNGQFGCTTWFPDSIHFLCNAYPGTADPFLVTEKDRVGIWEFSVQGGKPRMLRDMAIACCVSPDGSQIAFGTNTNREIWVMDASGASAHKVLDSGEDNSVFVQAWSADGQRLVYSREKGPNLLNMLSRDLKTGKTAEIETDFGRDAENVLALPDGRWIFGEGEPGHIVRSCNFWMARNDLRTGKLIEKPRRLTNWNGFCMNPTSATADGKKVAYLQYFGHPTVYVADLPSGGTRISNLRHFTLTDTSDYFCDWTPDSKALLFHSTRDGRDAIYRQSLNEDSPELLVRNQSWEGGVVSPDGKWLLYVQGPKSDEPSGLRQLMRIPIGGGTPQTIFPLQPTQFVPVCSRSSSNLCVIVELIEDRKVVILTAFDPVKGLGAELTRITLDYRPENPGVILSPDGTRIAVLAAENRIKILTIRGKLIKEIQVKGPKSLFNFNWAPDGSAIFVTGPVLGGHVLLRVTLDGQTQPVIESHAPDFIAGLPSPDGRHLVVTGVGDTKNIWMMENF